MLLDLCYFPANTLAVCDPGQIPLTVQVSCPWMTTHCCTRTWTPDLLPTVLSRHPHGTKTHHRLQGKESGRRTMQSATAATTARALPRLATRSTSGSCFAHPHSLGSSPGLKRPIVGPCSGVRRGTTAQTHQSSALYNVHHATCTANTLQTKVPATGTGEPLQA